MREKCMRKLMAVVLVLTICLPLAGCGGSDKEKADFINNSANDIYIGLAYPVEEYGSSTGFSKGIELALQEINDSGGILQRKVQLVQQDDRGSVTTGAEIAQSFVDDKRISAVIGHWNSRVSLAAAGIYNNAGLLMLSPASTAPKLTAKGYTTIFRNIPNDNVIGAKMAQYAVKQGYAKTVVYYADDDYGLGLANAFEDQGSALGLKVVDRVTGISDSQLSHLIKRWQAFGCDSIFVADVMPAAGDFIKKLRAAGVSVPIMGATGIDRSNFIDSLGKDAEGVVMPTVFNPDEDKPAVQEFVAKYKNKYGAEPDSWAVQGYEALKLVAWAMERAGSPLPERHAAALRELSGFNGVSGALSATSTGEINGQSIFFKIVVDGRYKYFSE